MKALIEINVPAQKVTSWVYDNQNNFFERNFEVIADSARVAQVEEIPFDVASPLFWMDCATNVIADLWYYEKSTGAILPIPEPVPLPVPIDQPVAIGAQTL